MGEFYIQRNVEEKPWMNHRKSTNFFSRVVIILLIVTLSLPLTGFNATHIQANETKFNMSYVYFGNTSSYIQQVKNTRGALDVVAPSYFDLNKDGSLNNKVDPKFVEEMHRQNVRVVPFLSNHWDQALGRKALANRDQLARQIAKAVMDFNLDGVNVDIENVNHLDKNNYTDLVHLLRKYLPADKEVSVAVAANPNGWTQGWHGSYDYKELAKYSDYLMLMTYDESWRGSAPGPVASISFVERSIQYALKQGVPSEKIVLGIPFFARYWVNGVGGFGISSNSVDTLVERYNGIVVFDEKFQSPRATFTIKQGDPVTRLNSRDLVPGNYTVWYENLQSIEKKIELIHKYNLKGTGSWALNQAPTNIWDHYMVWLNRTGFFDINTHWAKDDILAMFEKEWMVGIAKNQFSPNRPLTRAEATVVLVRALGLKEQVPKGMHLTYNFTDIENHWAKEEIILAYQFGIAEGIDWATFAPEKRLSREEMATLMSRVVHKDEKESTIAPAELSFSIFNDMDLGRWSYPNIAAMAKRSILRGFDDGNFYPEKHVTRAELAAVMNRMSTDETISTIFKR